MDDFAELQQSLLFKSTLLTMENLYFHFPVKQILVIKFYTNITSDQLFTLNFT